MPQSLQLLICSVNKLILPIPPCPGKTKKIEDDKIGKGFAAINVKIDTRPDKNYGGDTMAVVYHKIIRYIDAHIKNDISLAEIACAVGYSANHIYKLFKIYSPYPIMEYVRRMKLYHAANEMYTGRKLYDIA